MQKQIFLAQRDDSDAFKRHVESGSDIKISEPLATYQYLCIFEGCTRALLRGVEPALDWDRDEMNQRGLDLCSSFVRYCASVLWFREGIEVITFCTVGRHLVLRRSNRVRHIF